MKKITHKKPARAHKSAPSNITADAITAKSITLTSGDGKHHIAMQATDNGVGIWLHGEKSDECLCIVSGFGQGAYFGVHNPKLADACPVALTTEGVHLTAGKDYKFLSVADLLALSSK